MQFKWYAAFHDTTHHPHIHLLVYSENTKEGFLTNEGINKIRSAFANDIFKDDLQSIYQEQTLSRNELKAVSKTEFKSIVRKVQQGGFENPQLENLIRKLYSQLQNVKGKKYMGTFRLMSKKRSTVFFQNLQKTIISVSFMKMVQFGELEIQELYAKGKRTAAIG